MKLKTDKSMQEKIELFYKEETTWFPDHVGFTFCGLMILGITLIWWGLAGPAADGESGEWKVAVSMGAMDGLGFSMLRQRYLFYKEGKNNCILELLRYVPVSKEQLLIFVWKKQLFHMRWMFFTALMVQLFFGIVVFRELSIWNFFMPLLGCVILPVFWEGLAAIDFYRKS